MTKSSSPIIKESINCLSLVFASLFLFHSFAILIQKARWGLSVCDLRQIKMIIHVSLCYQSRWKIWDAPLALRFVDSADGMGLKWSWWQSPLRLASSQSCQGNGPPDVAGDLGARRRHAEWRCPVNNHWPSHFNPCRWSGSEPLVKWTLLAVNLPRINVLSTRKIAKCHNCLRTILEAVIFGNLDHCVTV